MFLDGFDTQAISYIAPLIAKEWNLSRELLGLIFSSALTGLMAGYLVLSPLSDRFGHRRMLLASTFTFALFTLTTAFAGGSTGIMVLRFLAGVGLGAAIPSAVALTTDSAPERLRSTFVLAIYCGFSLGFIAAGLVASVLLPVYGWRSILWVGAIAPLALAAFLSGWLPKSIDVVTMESAIATRHNAVTDIFRSGRGAATLLLWLVFIINLGEFYALQSWLPTILTGLHYSISTVALVTSLTTAGGIAAAFVVGPAMDRLGSYGSLSIVYLGGVVFLALLGAALNRAGWMLLTAAFFAGFCVSGGQKSVIALAACFYPAAVRSTGVGWALGIGRIGGVGGPWLFGMLLALNVTPANAFYAAAIPMLLAAGTVMLIGRNSRDAARILENSGCVPGIHPEFPPDRPEVPIYSNSSGK
jgi:AAHS family 4-hydroxybenzoate transporter-like MFS transporter